MRVLRQTSRVAFEKVNRRIVAKTVGRGWYYLPDAGLFCGVTWIWRLSHVNAIDWMFVMLLIAHQ